jgi:hypothetical protein
VITFDPVQGEIVQNPFQVANGNYLLTEVRVSAVTKAKIADK